MPTGIAIIAALPREVAALVRGTVPDPMLLKRGIHLHRVRESIIVVAGMGAERAAVAVEAAMAASPATMLISAGLAGACTAEYPAGSVTEATLVIDAQTGERFTTVANGGDECVLATTAAIAGVSEKRRLGATYGASIVDMEAATVARLARAHGLAFRAIKAISDAHDFELAGLSRFAGKQGSFRTGAFAMHTALRPRNWSNAMQLGRDGKRALEALNVALRATTS
jgi:adenosylhomocysteine nucleosidase